MKNCNILKITVPFRAKLLLVKKKLKVSKALFLFFVSFNFLFNTEFLAEKRHVNLKTEYILT